MFCPRATPYNLRNPVSFKMRKVCSVYSGNETLSHLGPKIWSLTPPKTRQSVSLGDFKSSIRKWTPSNCPCQLFKKYLHQICSFEKTYAHKFGSYFQSHIFQTFNILKIDLYQHYSVVCFCKCKFYLVFYDYTYIV